MLIDYDEALLMLEDAIAHHGTAKALAEHIGVAPATITQIRKGDVKMGGKVMTFLKLTSVHAFELSESPNSAQQEEYRNKRNTYLQQQVAAGHLPHYHPDKGVRSISTDRLKRRRQE